MPRARALPTLVLWLLLPAQAAAQVSRDRPDPQVVADEFHRGFQSMAWEGLVQRVHPEALAHLRYAADILVRIDTTGFVLETLLGGVAPAEYEGLPDGDVVVRVLRGVQREVPGLLSSLVSRRTEILGVVPEGEDRHVVYRVVALVQGAEPRVRVMTLSLVEDRWRVREADDIQVLHTAIRGIPIPGIRTP